MRIIPTVFISHFGVFNTSPLPKGYLSLPRILRIMTPPPPNSPRLKSSQGPVFLGAHFNTPQPSLPRGGLFVHINKYNSVNFKGLRDFHPIIVKLLTIRSAQEYTISHLHTSTCGTFYIRQRHLSRD